MLELLHVIGSVDNYKNEHLNTLHSSETHIDTCVTKEENLTYSDKSSLGRGALKCY